MRHVKERETRTRAGLITMLVAVIYFTCIDTSAKWLILAGLPALQVVFVRYFGHLLLALALYLPQEGPDLLKSTDWKRQLLRSFFLLGSTVLNFSALKYLPITLTTSIMFAGPIVVTLLAIPMLGELVGIRRLIAVCTGFVGVLIVIQPWGAAFHPAVFFSLGALVSASLYFVMTRMTAGTEANSTQQVWASGIATLALLPWVLEGWTWPDSLSTWIPFILIGAFGAAGHIAATIAHRWADASILAPVVYVQIFTVTFVSVLVFGSWPTVWTLVGGLIIIGSGLYIWQRERSLAKRTSLQSRNLR